MPNLVGELFPPALSKYSYLDRYCEGHSQEDMLVACGDDTNFVYCEEENTKQERHFM